MLKVTVDGQSTLLRALNQVERAIADWRPAWEACERYFYQIEAQQFASMGTRGGEPWRQLSPEYGKWKALHYPGKPILEREGDLKESLQGRGEYAIRDLQPTSLTLGSTHPAAVPHQRGAGRLPQRQPIAFTNSDLGQFTRRMLKFMQTAGAKAGFQTVAQGGRL